MANKDFTYSFETAKKPEEVFGLLLQIPQWWSGLYEETIEGKSDKVNDTFSFAAGRGALQYLLSARSEEVFIALHHRSS